MDGDWLNTPEIPCDDEELKDMLKVTPAASELGVAK